MYPVSNAFLDAVKENNRKYYWTGRITTTAGTVYEFDQEDMVKGSGYITSQCCGSIFGTIPIAEALLAKGALLGTILSFMMAVTTLSLPSLIMLKKAIKPKRLRTFIAICAAGIIIVGYGFNVFQNLFI